MALRGAEILIYPTAIGWESSDSSDEQQRQREAWITVQRGHAVANGLPLVAVNRVGHEPDPSGATNGISFWGSSFCWQDRRANLFFRLLPMPNARQLSTSTCAAANR